MKPIIKICGITRDEDAALCSGAGADWLGFIFHEASPRFVSPPAAAAFETGAAKRVGVFVNHSPDEVRDIMEAARLDFAQLHGGQGAAFCRAVGPERVIRAVWPQRFPSADDFRRELDELADAAAYFLFDSGQGGGGHGLGFDLGLIRGLCPPQPWLLAGGLTAERAAGLRFSDIPALHNLAGFDFNSGVEQAPGRKDRRLVESAVEAVRRAFAR